MSSSSGLLTPNSSLESSTASISLYTSLDACIMAETITHIVLFKYRAGISWTDFEAHFVSFMALKTKSLHPESGLPLIKSLKAGKNRSWEPFSKGITHGFVLEFSSQEDLDYYLTQEPVHLQFSKEAKPLVEDSVVIDIKDGVLFGPAAEHPDLKKEGVRVGACHCEAVRWTALLSSAEHVLCHCSTCQKLGGGPYSCNQIIPRQDLNIISGNGNVGVYKYKGASGKFVSCYFCKTCTSHIYHHQDVMPENVIVRTLLLDGGDQMPATGEIFAEGRLGWVGELKQTLGVGS